MRPRTAPGTRGLPWSRRPKHGAIGCSPRVRRRVTVGPCRARAGPGTGPGPAPGPAVAAAVMVDDLAAVRATLASHGAFELTSVTGRYLFVRHADGSEVEYVDWTPGISVRMLG